MGLDNQQLAARVADYEPEMTVVTTAPTYLFWRCAQPELRGPRYFLEQLGERGCVKVAIGPHGSATPRAALQNLGCDALVLGEAEEAIVELADSRCAPICRPASCRPEPESGALHNWAAFGLKTGRTDDPKRRKAAASSDIRY